MNKWTYVCLVAGLFLLAAPAGALIPDTIETLDTGVEWVTAGSTETSVVTALVTNSSNPLPGVTVAFTVDTTDGTVSPAQAVTDSDGKATTVFKPGTSAGSATIMATVSHEGLAAPLKRSVDQKVDHAPPYIISNLWYEPKVTAGDTTEIVVRLHDKYGNPIDNRRVAETVTFRAGSPAGGTDASFVGSTDEIAVPVDADGNATATLRAGTVAGENLIFIEPPKPVKITSITITVMGQTPYSLMQAVTPADGSVPADGEKTISVIYELLDQYGNPAPGQGLRVEATVKRMGLPDEHQSSLLYSNDHGLVKITYGPEESTGTVTITATSVENPGLKVSKVLVFTSTDPVNMLLTASPQTMPSGDVRSDFRSELRAKVMDIKGNPVEDETVTFQIVSVNFAPYNQTVAPNLESLSAKTNADGYAIVKFSPGHFTTDKNAVGWSNTSTATATVRATWGNVSKDIDLDWMNYPYLSVETEVAPETVAVNNTVDVTIRLRGDGYAMQPDPIDVVLVIDRSGSMLYDNPDRMHSVREAAKIFVGELAESHDRAAVVSFGRNGYISRPGDKSQISWSEIDNNYVYPKTYSDFATLDASLTYDHQSIKENLDGIVPDHGTPMRGAVYKAINELNASGRSDDAVQAIVLLSDGDYNWYGDPLARGTGYTKYEYDPDSSSKYKDLTTNYYKFSGLSDSEQDLSVYAQNKKIKIYSIGYSESITAEGKNTLKILAESTGGKYYNGSAANIDAVYTDIAGELKTEAGVDTKLDLVFRDVEVNGTLESGADVFDYVHLDGVSTTIESWIDNKTGRHVVIPFMTIDQTADWNANHNLNFDIGTVHLGQTWETTFRLKVLKDGNINIFGPGSTISFNDGANTLVLPDTFITALPDLNNTGFTSAWLEVTLYDPVPPHGEESFYDTVPLKWYITYNGTQEIYGVLSYSNDNKRSWTSFWTKNGVSPGPGSALMDVRDLPSGPYHIRIVASASDVPGDEDETTVPISIRSESRAYIKIE